MQPKGEQDYWNPSTAADQPAPAASIPADSTEGLGRPDDTQGHSDDTQNPYVEPITWQASEYVHHEKGFLWFLALSVAVFVLVLLAYFILHSWTFVLLVLVMAAAAAVYARRPPRTLTYTVTSKGIQIDERTYSYHEFRAFALVKEDPLYSVMLIPVKRFMPAISLYFPPESGEKIVDVLGSVLPFEQRELDAVDKIVRKLRF